MSVESFTEEFKQKFWEKEMLEFRLRKREEDLERLEVERSRMLNEITALSRVLGKEDLKPTKPKK